MYGGLEPEVTNAVLVYGQHDPWNVIGRTTDLNENAVAIVMAGKVQTIFHIPVCLFFHSVAGATQGNDLPPIRDIDSAAVVAAKHRIQEIIERWLDEAN